jgi:hypothetical protein
MQSGLGLVFSLQPVVGVGVGSGVGVGDGVALPQGIKSVSAQ